MPRDPYGQSEVGGLHAICHESVEEVDKHRLRFRNGSMHVAIGWSGVVGPCQQDMRWYDACKISDNDVPLLIHVVEPDEIQRRTPRSAWLDSIIRLSPSRQGREVEIPTPAEGASERGFRARTATALRQVQVQLNRSRGKRRRPIREACCDRLFTLTVPDHHLPAPPRKIHPSTAPAP